MIVSPFNSGADNHYLLIVIFINDYSGSSSA